MDTEDLKELLALARPRFILAGFLLYALGALVAILEIPSFSLQQLAFAYAIVLLGQVSFSYANDYFDAQADKKFRPTPFSGGSGALQRRPGLAPLARRIAIALAIASVLVSLAYAFTYQYGEAVFIFALAANLLGWYFSAPPVSLAKRGYGEYATALAAGFAIPAFGNIAVAGDITTLFLYASIPFTCLGFAFALGAQIPDAEADRQNAKKTFASSEGRPAAFTLLLAMEAIAALSLLALHFLHPAPKNAFPALAALSLLPLAFAAKAYAARNSGEQATTKNALEAVASLFLFAALSDAYLLIAASGLA
jgi:1,4-dihydroxy-2-naphthoate octaprenyltransferase